MKSRSGTSHSLTEGINAIAHQGKEGLRQWSRLLLARGCPVCDRPTNQTFCLDCERQILPAAEQPTKQQQAVQPWAQNEVHPLPVSALGLYNGALKRAIVAMKYANRPEVAAPLGHAIAQQWLSQPLRTQGCLYAVPIPLHAERQATRGYNQAELIARAFCRASGLPLLTHGLIRTQATLPQHQLSLDARQQNLAKAFEVGPFFRRSPPIQTHWFNPSKGNKPKPSILLIDDIYTTGATARNAAEVLAQAGVSVVGMLVVARAVLA